MQSKFSNLVDAFIWDLGRDEVRGIEEGSTQGFSI